MEMLTVSEIEQLCDYYDSNLGVLQILQWGQTRGVREHVARFLSLIASLVAFLWLCVAPTHSHFS
jgi:hypothetical protein